MYVCGRGVWGVWGVCPYVFISETELFRPFGFVAIVTRQCTQHQSLHTLLEKTSALGAYLS